MTCGRHNSHDMLLWGSFVCWFIPTRFFDFVNASLWITAPFFDRTQSFLHRSVRCDRERADTTHALLRHHRLVTAPVCPACENIFSQVQNQSSLRAPLDRKFEHQDPESPIEDPTYSNTPQKLDHRRNASAGSTVLRVRIHGCLREGRTGNVDMCPRNSFTYELLQEQPRRNGAAVFAPDVLKIRHFGINQPAIALFKRQ